MPKLFNIFILVIALIILVGLSRQIADAMQAGQRLDRAVEEVSKLQEENKTLKKKNQEVLSAEYVEEVARNKLNMAKNNETVVIIEDQALNQVMGSKTEEKKQDFSAYWQGWLRLFFR